MRKVLVFGAENGYVGSNARFFMRRGLELAAYSSGAALGPAPVLLVFGGGMSKKDKDGLGRLLAADRRLPVVLVHDGSPEINLREVRKRARYTLPPGSPRKYLLNALKCCSEILELSENVEQLRTELKLKTVELSYVLDIGKALASSFELPKVLKKIMERMRVLVGASHWAVMLMDDMDQELVLESARGVTGRKVRAFRLGLGEGVAGWCARDREPKIVADAAAEKRHSPAFEKASGAAVRSIMAVPILNGAKLLGVIELYNKQGRGGFRPEDLQLVTRLIDQISIAIERSVMYQKMADLVITDDLTKLFNMRYLDRTLEVEIERALRYNFEVSLIFMDIDYFKKVNDRYGHLTGSKLLVEVSQLLIRTLRKVDIVARYGGDEFVIVLPQTDRPAAGAIAERLRKGLSRHVFLKAEGLALRVTASFGIASYPSNASTKEELFKLADEAMYRVKYGTRNSVYMAGTADRR